MRAWANIRGDTITGTADFVDVERDTQRLVRISMRVHGDPAVLTPGLHMGDLPNIRIGPDGSGVTRGRRLACGVIRRAE